MFFFLEYYQISNQEICTWKGQIAWYQGIPVYIPYFPHCELLGRFNN